MSYYFLKRGEFIEFERERKRQNEKDTFREALIGREMSERRMRKRKEG
jgi:hypothetical protein